MTLLQIEALESDVDDAALSLGRLEADKANEYLRLTRFQDVRGWDASMRVDAQYAARIREAQGCYEIAVAALRRAQ